MQCSTICRGLGFIHASTSSTHLHCENLQWQMYTGKDWPHGHLRHVIGGRCTENGWQENRGPENAGRLQDQIWGKVRRWKICFRSCILRPPIGGPVLVRCMSHQLRYWQSAGPGAAALKTCDLWIRNWCHITAHLVYASAPLGGVNAYMFYRCFRFFLFFFVFPFATT